MKDFMIRLIFGLSIFAILLFIIPMVFNYDFYDDYENLNRNRLLLIFIPLTGGWLCWYIYKAVIKDKK